MNERSRSSGLWPVPSDTCPQVRPPARAGPICLALYPEFIHPSRPLHTITSRRGVDEEELYFSAVSVLLFVFARIDRGSHCCVW